LACPGGAANFAGAIANRKKAPPRNKSARGQEGAREEVSATLG
jgi:hypothetical protein